MPRALPHHRRRRARASTDEEFRELSRASRRGLGGATPTTATWERFAEPLALRRRRRRLRARSRDGGRRAPSEELGGEPRRLHYLSLPPRRAPGDRRGARRRRPRRARAGDHREAVRHRPRLGARAQRRSCTRSSTSAHLPHRPLPRPRGGAEPAGAALRQRHVRAGLEPQPHRPRPDRRPRDALDRDARRLLRGDRRLPRHGRHPPLPGARLRRDGAADLARAEGARASRREKVFDVDAAAAARGRGPRPVRRLPRRGRASPPTPTPRPSSRVKRLRSTTGAGRACRSTCARASGWPRAGTC